MPLHSYKAIDSQGRAIRGQMEASNLPDLEMRLRRMGLDLIVGAPLTHRYAWRAATVSRRELINFCFHLEQLIQADIALREGLSDLRDSLENQRFREVISALIESIEGGKTLSQAMEAHDKIFSRVFVNLVRAGEASGNLPKVLQNLAESLKWEDELASQTKKIILYPAFVGSIVLSATFFLMIYMVPQLKQFVKNMGQELPLQTKILFFVSESLIDYGFFILLFFVALIIGVKLFLLASPSARFYADAFMLKLPFVGEILRKIILSRFANTFALLYESKLSILESLQITQYIVGNRVIEHGLQQAEQLIHEGKNITSAFQATGFFPPLVIRMLNIGETTGKLDTALLNAGYFYTRDVKESVEKGQQLIEPCLTVFLGVLLGWIMLSVLGPVYDIMSSMKI